MSLCSPGLWRRRELHEILLEAVASATSLPPVGRPQGNCLLGFHFMKQLPPPASWVGRPCCACFTLEALHFIKCPPYTCRDSASTRGICYYQVDHVQPLTSKVAPLFYGVGGLQTLPGGCSLHSTLQVPSLTSQQAPLGKPLFHLFCSHCWNRFLSPNNCNPAAFAEGKPEQISVSG